MPIHNASESDASEDGEEEMLSAFRQVIADYISTGHAEGHAAVDVLMEIKGFKFSQNKTFADCLSAVVPEIVALAIKIAAPATGGQSTPVQIIKALQKLLDMQTKGWGFVLLEALIQKETDDELVVIEIIEDVVLKEDSKTSLRSLFCPMLQLIYHSELVTEQTFLRWSAMRDDLESPEDPKRKLFDEPKVQEFLDWLQASSSDEEEDDSEDEDEDEDEG